MSLEFLYQEINFFHRMKRKTNQKSILIFSFSFFIFIYLCYTCLFNVIVINKREEEEKKVIPLDETERNKCMAATAPFTRSLSLNMKKVLFYDSKNYDEKTFKQALKDLNGHKKIRLTFLESKLNEETVDEAEGYDAVCVFVNDILDANVIQQLSQEYNTVKIIALRCAGFDNVDLQKAQESGIKVCRVPRYSPYAVAEHSVALLLSLNRNLHHAYLRTKQHNFTLDGLVGIDLFGKTVGVIGTGGIGMCAINIFLGFGCKVLAYDLYPNEQAAKEKGFSYVTMDQLLRESDVGRRFEIEE